MKQHASIILTDAIQRACVHSIRGQVDEAMWDAIKATVGQMSLPSGWVRSYSDRSLSVRSTTQAFILKITLDKQLFIDRRMKDKSYRCEVLKFETTEEATSTAVALINAVVNKQKLHVVTSIPLSSS